MKQYGYTMVWGLCLFGLLGCTASHPMDDGAEQGLPVPVVLRAGSQTRAVVNAGDAFNPLLVCSDKADFSGSSRWNENVSVATNGAVTYPGEAPVYPSLGDYIYVAGLHPQGAVLSGNGTAVYTLDGTADLMYAAPLHGNCWDGFRICGNTDASKDKQLAFNHLLTQVKLTAIRTAQDLAGHNDFRITKLTWKNVPATATIQLKEAAEGGQQVSFSSASTLSAVLYKDKANETKTVLVTSNNEAKPDAVGYVLLPPAGSYTVDVESSIGVFTDLEVKPSDGGFESGYAHEILMVLNDRGLSIRGVKLQDWEDVDGGDTDVN